MPRVRQSFAPIPARSLPPASRPVSPRSPPRRAPRRRRGQPSHTAHGDALRAAGAHGSALEAYHAAIRAQRRFAPAYEGRAEAELALDQFRPAIRSLDVAIGFSPENVALYGRRALAFCWIGQVDAAMTDWARAREVDAAAGIEQLALLAALEFYKGDPGAGFARDALQAQRAYGDAGCP